MEAKVKTALQFIELTKKEVREREREEALVNVFELLFGFMPDWLEWKTECMEKVLEAKAEVEELEKITIVGEIVQKVIFYLKEDPRENNLDPNWNFSSFSRTPYTVYKFIKRMRGYIAKVEVLTK